MNDNDSQECTPLPARPTKSRLHTAVRVILCVAAVIGMWRAIGSSRRVAALQLELKHFSQSVGHLPIKDPKKVYVLALPKYGQNIWRFRVHLPAQYDATELHRYGQISASTPRHRIASGGSSSGGVTPEPVEYFVIIAFLKEKGQWELHTTSANSRSSGSFGPEFGELLDNRDSLIVDQVGENGAAEFDPDEPICLLRIRSKEPVRDQADLDPLYHGFFYYIVPRKSLKIIEAAQRAG